MDLGILLASRWADVRLDARLRVTLECCKRSRLCQENYGSRSRGSSLSSAVIGLTRNLSPSVVNGVCVELSIGLGVKGNILQWDDCQGLAGWQSAA